MGYKSQILREIEKYTLKVDTEKILLAYEFAKEAHLDQKRKSGDPYIMHPVEVAKILITMKMDTDTIVAGLLHDVVEDTLITIIDIKCNFGENVAHLVEGVTKLKKLPGGTQTQAENIRKMIVAMAKDVRVVIIKLADRLHNMRTLKHMREDKQKRIANETLKIFAPLAHRMGMAKIKWELEDLSLYYLEPKKYRELVEMVAFKRKVREEYTNKITKILNQKIEQYKINGEVTGRPKHFYSIYKKMYEKGKKFQDIYDLIAMRVIVETEEECYHILGIVHNLWTPVPGRFKDYIAVPKSNGYQSIHTTIVGEKGNFVEIQIRTSEMHRIAEEGIAAHWKYKEKVTNTKSDNIYSWLRKILEWQQEEDDSEIFIQAVTGDILSEEVFIFTPKGDVLELPKGATPLDFAFHIHTQVGFKCIGAKVNHKIVPIDYKLQNGDKVEIITTKTPKAPGKDWINIVATHSAKSKIRRWFKYKEFDEKAEEGRNILEKELANHGIKIKKCEEEKEIQTFLKKHRIAKIEELFYQIATGKTSTEAVLSNFEINKKDENIQKNLIKKEKKQKSTSGVIIEGIDNIVIRFAKCCTPVPGDEISGYITKGAGIAIHRNDCKNFESLKERNPERIINVRWDDENTNISHYTVKFNVIVTDRPNILNEILQIISDKRINIVGLSSVSFKDGGKNFGNIQLSVEIT
ncbi:MAG: guanosine-3',5'-bis(diphosphate) 3'-pyrophosphohydrolase, partial [Fusobacteriia bacterium 4572_132]